MDPWITVNELAVWTRKAIDLNDEFALLVLEAATIKVSEATGVHDTPQAFTASTAPDALKVIVAQVAKRAYRNPDQIVHEGGLGPLHGDTFAAAYAAGLTLTDEELAEIDKVTDRALRKPKGGIRIFGFRVAHHGTYGGGVTHLPDSSGSDWMIPYEEQRG